MGPEFGDNSVNNAATQMENSNLCPQDERRLVNRPANMQPSTDQSVPGGRGGNYGQSTPTALPALGAPAQPSNHVALASTLDSFENPFDPNIYFRSKGGAVDIADTLPFATTHLQQAVPGSLQQPPAATPDVTEALPTASTPRPMSVPNPSARGKRKRKSSKKTGNNSGTNSAGIGVPAAPSSSSAVADTSVPTAAAAPDPTSTTTTASSSATAQSTSPTGNRRRRKLNSKKLQGLSEEEVETRRLRTNKLEKERMDRQAAAMKTLASVLPDEVKDENQNLTFINTIRVASRYIAFLVMCLKTGVSVHGQVFQLGVDKIREAMNSRWQTDIIDMSLLKSLFDQDPNSFFPTLKQEASGFDIGGLMLQSATPDFAQVLNALQSEALTAVSQSDAYEQLMSNLPGLALSAMTQGFQNVCCRFMPDFTGTQPQGQTAIPTAAWPRHFNMQQPTGNPLAMPPNIPIWQPPNQFRPPFPQPVLPLPAAAAPLVSNPTVMQPLPLHPAMNHSNHNQGQLPQVYGILRPTYQPTGFIPTHPSNPTNFMPMPSGLFQAPAAVNGHVNQTNAASVSGVSQEFVHLFNSSTQPPQSNGTSSPPDNGSTSTPSTGQPFRFTPPTGNAPRPAKARKSRGRRSESLPALPTKRPATATTNGNLQTSTTAGRQVIGDAFTNALPTPAFSSTPPLNTAGISTPLTSPMNANHGAPSGVGTGTSQTGLSSSPVDTSTLTPIQKIALSLQNDSGFGSEFATPLATPELYQSFVSGSLHGDVVLPDEFLDYEASL